MINIKYIIQFCKLCNYKPKLNISALELLAEVLIENKLKLNLYLILIYLFQRSSLLF